MGYPCPWTSDSHPACKSCSTFSPHLSFLLVPLFPTLGMVTRSIIHVPGCQICQIIRLHESHCCTFSPAIPLCYTVRCYMGYIVTWMSDTETVTLHVSLCCIFSSVSPSLHGVHGHQVDYPHPCRSGDSHHAYKSLFTFSSLSFPLSSVLHCGHYLQKGQGLNPFLSSQNIHLSFRCCGLWTLFLMLPFT